MEEKIREEMIVGTDGISDVYKTVSENTQHVISQQPTESWQRLWKPILLCTFC